MKNNEILSDLLFTIHSWACLFGFERHVFERDFRREVSGARHLERGNFGRYVSRWGFLSSFRTKKRIRERNDTAGDDTSRTARTSPARGGPAMICWLPPQRARSAPWARSRSGFEARRIKTSVPPRITGSHCDTVTPSWYAGRRVARRHRRRCRCRHRRRRRCRRCRRRHHRPRRRGLRLNVALHAGPRQRRARMPVKVDVVPPPPANSKQPGVTKSLLYNGSRFQGSQKSKGNSYDVEVVLQVSRALSAVHLLPVPAADRRPPSAMPLCRHFSEIAPQIGECVYPVRDERGGRPRRRRGRARRSSFLALSPPLLSVPSSMQRMLRVFAHNPNWRKLDRVVNTRECRTGSWYDSSPCIISLQHVDEENSYLCGYLKIKGLTEEFPTLTTFFDGEIISKKYPFLTRKWDADEDVDKKHWVRIDTYRWSYRRP